MPYWVYGTEPNAEPTRFFSDAETPALAWEQAVSHGIAPARIEDVSDPEAPSPEPRRQTGFAPGVALGMILAPLLIVLLKGIFANAGLGDWRVIAVPCYLALPVALLFGFRRRHDLELGGRGGVPSLRAGVDPSGVDRLESERPQ